MAIIMKRQLNDEEKKIVLERHGRRCYANGHMIPDGEKIHFDHIQAYSDNGPTDLNNIAPMCEKHNLEKGRYSLEDFRIKLQIDEFFKSGQKLTLRHLLRYLRDVRREISSFGEPISLIKNDGKVKLENANFSSEFKIEKCPRTGWEYFYGIIPVSLIDSDDDECHAQGLQPRYLIPSKVFDMTRHFQRYPVLQPSIGRIDNNKILLFDGQHKVASLLWTGRQMFECKIYINPNLRILNEANISAHDKFVQTKFFSPIMVLKLGTQFGKDFEEYKNNESCTPKTEQGFLEYLSKKEEVPQSRQELRKKFRSYLYNSILEDDSNKWKPLISKSNRGSKEQPITLDMLTKSILANFLYVEPTNDVMLSDDFKREIEFKNIIMLMNAIFDRSLRYWNPVASPSDALQLKLMRMFSSKSIMAWSEIFKDSVGPKLELYDTDEQEKIFYRQLGDDAFDKIGKIIDRLVGWQMWSSPRDSEIDTNIASSKNVLKKWMKEHGLTTGYLLGAQE